MAGFMRLAVLLCVMYVTPCMPTCPRPGPRRLADLDRLFPSLFRSAQSVAPKGCDWLSKEWRWSCNYDREAPPLGYLLPDLFDVPVGRSKRQTEPPCEGVMEGTALSDGSTCCITCSYPMTLDCVESGGRWYKVVHLSWPWRYAQHYQWYTAGECGSSSGNCTDECVTEPSPRSMMVHNYGFNSTSACENCSWCNKPWLWLGLFEFKDVDVDGYCRCA